MVSSVAHRHPAANTPAVTSACPRLSGRSNASTSTTVSKLPTCSGCWPQVRAKLVAKMPTQASGNATPSPAARAKPNPAVHAAPMAVKASSAGKRRRIGPPASHRQVSSAPNAASSSGGQCSAWSNATIAATARAARTPSATLMARKSRLIGKRERSDSGPVFSQRMSGGPPPGAGGGHSRQAALAIPRSTYCRMPPCR